MTHGVDEEKQTDRRSERRRSDDKERYVRYSTFTWAIGLLAGMIIACVGWSFAAYSNAADAEKKVYELEIRLNRVDAELDKKLELIQQNTKAIAESLQRHEEDTSRMFASPGSSGSRTNRRGMEKAP